MEGSTPNNTKTVIPVTNSCLYRTILNCAKGRWQRNKALNLLSKGWTTDVYVEKDGYDYKKSLINLTDRIQGALKDTELYHLEYVKIEEDPKMMGYILVKEK